MESWKSKQTNFGTPARKEKKKKKKSKKYIRWRDCGALMVAGWDVF